MPNVKFKMRDVVYKNLFLKLQSSGAYWQGTLDQKSYDACDIIVSGSSILFTKE